MNMHGHQLYIGARTSGVSVMLDAVRKNGPLPTLGGETVSAARRRTLNRFATSVRFAGGSLDEV